MADTGWQDCSADEANSGWSSPENMQGQDGNDAVSSNTGNNVKQYNFGFSVPSGATIDGVEIRAYCNSFGGNRTVDLDLYYNSRATAAPDTKNITAPGSDAWVSTGGATDLWGRSSWADTDFTDANFAVKVTNAGGTFFLFIDAIQAKVYYTESTGWGHKINGVANANISKVNGIAKANISKINGV